MYHHVIILLQKLLTDYETQLLTHVYSSVLAMTVSMSVLSVNLYVPFDQISA